MTSKEQIVSFLETIPTIDLPEVFEAMNWICEKRGVEMPVDPFTKEKVLNNDVGEKNIMSTIDSIQSAINHLEDALGELE